MNVELKKCDRVFTVSLSQSEMEGLDKEYWAMETSPYSSPQNIINLVGRIIEHPDN